ncbi:hypothetical protein BT63DRAFT_483741 [Microthyrium microscopicum]|uniref:Uncharacterized protein n=1 Tax=Microthyrium microscopicum TaxID=703497 RepID=A0A6A6TZ92_9PEZI|nr:hypothetical protein BT63DRAFT_483741 [Microthyrium microscopicum]
MSSGCSRCGIGEARNCSYCAQKAEEQRNAEESRKAANLRQEQAARAERLDNEDKELRNKEAALRLEKARWEFEQQKKNAGISAFTVTISLSVLQFADCFIYHQKQNNDFNYG